MIKKCFKVFTEDSDNIPCLYFLNKDSAEIFLKEAEFKFKMKFSIESFDILDTKSNQQVSVINYFLMKYISTIIPVSLINYIPPSICFRYPDQIFNYLPPSICFRYPDQIFESEG